MFEKCENFVNILGKYRNIYAVKFNLILVIVSVNIMVPGKAPNLYKGEAL